MIYTTKIKLGSIKEKKLGTVKSIRKKVVKKRKSVISNKYDTYIRSLKKNPYNMDININCGDSETLLVDGNHIIFAIGVHFDDKYYEYFIDKGDLSEKNLNKEILEELSQRFIRRVFDHIFKYIKKDITIFFHNLSNFDGILILKGLVEHYKKIQVVSRNNVYYQIVIHSNDLKKTIKLQDSLHIIPASLEKAAKSVGINDLEKMSWDYKRNTIHNLFNHKFIDEVRIYMKNDVIVLKTILEKFIKKLNEITHLDPIKYLTLSSLAFAWFRTDFYKDKKVVKLKPDEDVFIRESYLGGVTEIYKPTNLDDQLVYYYDVNSLYPYMMYSNYFPIGLGKQTKDVSILEDPNFFGYIYAEVECPHNISIPFLSKKVKNKMIQPTGKFKGVFFSESLKYAKTLNYIIKPIKGIKFNKGRLFNKYIKHLYDLRLKSKKDSLENYILKLLMNSLYGRFGMTLDTIKTLLGNKKNFEYISKFYEIKNINQISDDLYIINYDDGFSEYITRTSRLQKKINKEQIDRHKKRIFLKRIHVNTAVHIASAITSYASIYMHKFKMKYSKNLLYSDTDSLFTTIPLDKKYISKTKLGFFKLEGVYKKAYFILPKFYALFDPIDDRQKSLFKFKGLSDYQKSDALFDKNLWESWLEDVDDLKKYVTIIKSPFKRNKLKFKVEYDKDERLFVIAMKYDKRKKLYKNKKWHDTQPFSYNYFIKKNL